MVNKKAAKNGKDAESLQKEPATELHGRLVKFYRVQTPCLVSTSEVGVLKTGMSA